MIFFSFVLSWTIIFIEAFSEGLLDSKDAKQVSLGSDIDLMQSQKPLIDNLLAIYKLLCDDIRVLAPLLISITLTGTTL